MSSNFQPSDINYQSESSSDKSSTIARIIPVNERRGKTESSSSDSESCSSQERRRRCIVEARVETQLSEQHNQAKGVTVQVLQSDLHRVRIHTPEGIEQRQEGCNPNEDLGVAEPNSRDTPLEV